MYKIDISKCALKFIAKQPKPQQELLLKAISKLPTGDIKPLKGHKNVYRLRVDAFRIIYTIDNGQMVICVIDAGNRGQIYKRY
ncbi:MAG: type II toxin-antitoxin system RelE/ParE family toxin [Lachnospiraceae bacterium]|nr:type II toxin-antitoxin system RelE/ParE family toxin [Lachnospiraceae bacterium]